MILLTPVILTEPYLRIAFTNTGAKPFKFIGKAAVTFLKIMENTCNGGGMVYAGWLPDH